MPRVRALVPTATALLLVMALAAQKSERRLVINGRTVPTSVIEREGHFYADLEVVAHALGGSVTLQPNQVALSVTPQPTAPVAQSNDNLSQEFQRASITTLGDLRQWVGAVSELITSGVPVAGQWPEEYRNRVQGDIMQTSVTATNNADRQALQLIQTLNTDVTSWASKIIDDRNALNGARNVDPYALQNDPTLAKITKCGQSLAAMIVHGVYADDASCH